MKERSEIAQEDTWDVEALYSSFDAWDQDFNRAKEKWPTLATYRGRLHEGAEVLKEALELSFEISRLVAKLATYAHLRHDEEITLDRANASNQKSLALSFSFQEETSWFEPELLSLDSEKIDAYLKDPVLADYRFHIEKIVRLRPHTLSHDKEALLAMAGRPLQTAPKAFSALNNADIRFSNIKDGDGKEHPLSHGTYQLYLRSSDRVLRENAFKEMHGQFENYENTLCELLSGQIESHVFEAEARNYPSCLEAALFSKKIPQEVYRSLIDSVREGLPALHRYVGLRKKILKLDEIHLYDMYVPLVPEVNFKMSYDEAEKHVIDSVAPLGKEYCAQLKKGLEEERWVDRYENKNKRSGAYSSGCYDSHPYILMNFKGILRDTFTLAHEAGHSMHSLLSRKSQPYHYSHYPIFVAEVASTFNEELLMHHLLEKTPERDRRLFLLNEKIEDIRATFFRQTMFAEFELSIHELVEGGTPLTLSLLKQLYLKLNTDYFGPDAVIDEEISVEWARIPHFYYNFYVYQYATGISAALSLAKNVLDGDQNARDAFLQFLNGGSSLFPIDLLKLAGVDMASPAPVAATLQKFDHLVTELESTLALNS